MTVAALAISASDATATLATGATTDATTTAATGATTDATTTAATAATLTTNATTDAITAAATAPAKTFSLCLLLGRKGESSHGRGCPLSSPYAGATFERIIDGIDEVFYGKLHVGQVSVKKKPRYQGIAFPNSSSITSTHVPASHVRRTKGAATREHRATVSTGSHIHRSKAWSQ